YAVLAAISICHFLNDMMQSLLPAIYPILKDNYGLTFAQVGLLTFTFQFTASLLQPAIGYYTDQKPKPYSLAIGMSFTLVGLLLLSRAGSFGTLLLAAGLIGSGSAVLHPESSRVARMAAGPRPGFAQAVFQVGGNLGSAIGPLLAAFIVLPRAGGAGERRRVFARCRDRDRAPDLRRALVRPARPRTAHAEAKAAHRGAAAARPRRRGARGAGRADLLEVLLYGEHVELLHVLSD